MTIMIMNDDEDGYNSDDDRQWMHDADGDNDDDEDEDNDDSFFARQTYVLR